VLRTAKGGVASAWMLHDMMERGLTPRALIFNSVNPILAQGAAFANLTLVDRFADGDVTELFETGDELRVEPENGTVTILNRRRAA
jgi:predicted aconitase with swiveling domain